MSLSASSALTNTQLEILRAFSHELSEKELAEFRDVIDRYFAERAVQAANEAWDRLGWTNETAQELLKTKLRKRAL